MLMREGGWSHQILQEEICEMTTSTPQPSHAPADCCLLSTSSLFELVRVCWLAFHASAQMHGKPEITEHISGDALEHDPGERVQHSAARGASSSTRTVGTWEFIEQHIFEVSTGGTLPQVHQWRLQRFTRFPRLLAPKGGVSVMRVCYNVGWVHCLEMLRCWIGQERGSAHQQQKSMSRRLPFLFLLCTRCQTSQFVRQQLGLKRLLGKARWKPSVELGGTISSGSVVCAT